MAEAEGVNVSRYLDANVFCHAALDKGPKGERAREVLRQTATGAHPAVTAVLTLDETTWIIRKEVGLEHALREGSRLLAFPNLYVLDVKAKHFASALDFMEDHAGLRPRDAIHAAVAIDAGVFTLVSDDDDFDAIRALTRVPLTPVKP